MVSSLSIYLNLFQSTHPRGVRQEEVIKDIQAAEDFNPRTREGCDKMGLDDEELEDIISIHAPARGATRI